MPFDTVRMLTSRVVSTSTWPEVRERLGASEECGDIAEQEREAIFKDYMLSEPWKVCPFFVVKTIRTCHVSPIYVCMHLGDGCDRYRPSE